MRSALFHIFITLILFSLCSFNIYSQEEEKFIENYHQLFSPQNIKKLYQKIKEGKLSKEEIEKLKQKLSTTSKQQKKNQKTDKNKEDYKNILKLLSQTEKTKEKKSKVPPLSKFFETKYGNLLIIIPGGILLIILIIFIFLKMRKLSQKTSHKINLLLAQKNIENADKLFLQKNFDKAIELYKENYPLLLENQYSWNNYLQALIQSKNYSLAISEMEKYDKKFGLSLNEKIVLAEFYALKKQKTKAVTLISNILNTHHTLEEEQLEKLKSLSKELEDYALTIDILKKLIELYPKNTSYLEELAQLYLEQNAYSEAIIILEKLKEINPKNSFPYLKAAQFHYKNKAYKQATKELSTLFQNLSEYNNTAHLLLQEIIQKEPRFLEAKYLLAKLLEKKNLYLKDLESLYPELASYYEDILISYANYLEHFHRETDINPYLKKFIIKNPHPKFEIIHILLKLALNNNDQELFIDCWNSLEKSAQKTFFLNFIEKENHLQLKSLDDRVKYHLLSKMAYDCGEKEIFIDIFSQLIAIQPDYDLELLFNYLLLTHSSSKKEKNKLLLKQLLEKYPHDIKLIFLSLLYEISADNQISQLEKTFLEHLEETSWVQFINIIKNMSHASPQLILLLAQKASQFNNSQNILPLLEPMLEKDLPKEDKEKLLLHLGEIYFKNNQIQKAVNIISPQLETTSSPDIIKLGIRIFSKLKLKEKIIPLIEKIILQGNATKSFDFLLKITEEQLSSDPRNQNFLFWKSTLLLLTGKTYEAFIILDKILNKQNDFYTLFKKIFSLYYPTKNTIQKYILKKFLEFDPQPQSLEPFFATIPEETKDTEFLLLKSEYLIKKGSPLEALSILTSLEKENSNENLSREILHLKYKAYYKTNKKKKALQILHQLKEKFKLNVEDKIKELEQEITTSLFQEAEKAFKEGNYTQAINYLQKLLRRNIPDSEKYKVRLLLGKAFLSKSLFDLGFNELIYLQKQLFENPNPHLEILYQLGETFEEYGYLDEAKETFKFILGKDISFKNVFKKIEDLDKKTPLKLSTAPENCLHILQTQLSERYENYKLLGQGGSSYVFRAYDKKLDRPVAIKMLKENLLHDPEQLRRFLQTAKAIAGFTHPNIAKIYDIEEKNPFVFLIMELIEGENLKEIIKKDKLSIKEKVKILTQIAQGIAYAHNMGIIHRDIKPENIILEHSTQLIKIMDFGIAKIEYLSTMTKTGMKMGTPYYMSPEQIRGERVTASSDIYSFGMLAYELLTGKKAFSEGDLTYLHLFSFPPPPSSKNPQITKNLDDIVIKCIQKEIKDRFRTAEDLCQALQEVKV